MTIDLLLWPWPGTKVVITCDLHVVSVLWTCVVSYFQILKIVQKLLSGRIFSCIPFDLSLLPWPWTKVVVTCTLHIVFVWWTFAAIYSKILQSGSKVNEQTQFATDKQIDTQSKNNIFPHYIIWERHNDNYATLHLIDSCTEKPVSIPTAFGFRNHEIHTLFCTLIWTNWHFKPVL